VDCEAVVRRLLLLSGLSHSFKITALFLTYIGRARLGAGEEGALASLPNLENYC
jgi:hypothetical protein